MTKSPEEGAELHPNVEGKQLVNISSLRQVLILLF
jgi:hypothetical protein